MTDKQKEYLFKSIENFDLFLNKVNKRITIELLNEGKITFDKNYVIIFINNQTEQLNIEEFLTLTKEIIEQKVVDLKAEIQKIQEKINFQRTNELTIIGNKIYQVEKEYFDALYFARDIASGQGYYKKQLLKIVNIINLGNVVIINNKSISTITELETEMQDWYGFQSINKELSNAT